MRPNAARLRQGGTGEAMKRGKKLTKDDDGDVDGAEDPELVGLLEETVLALYIWTKGEDDRPASC